MSRRVIFWHENANEGLSGRTAVTIPMRVAVTEVSHWHSVNDASYLRILRDLGCDIVGVSDRSAQIAGERAPNSLAAPRSPNTGR